jgi:hypothetical protein
MLFNQNPRLANTKIINVVGNVRFSQVVESSENRTVGTLVVYEGDQLGVSELMSQLGARKMLFAVSPSSSETQWLFFVDSQI